MYLVEAVMPWVVFSILIYTFMLRNIGFPSEMVNTNMMENSRIASSDSQQQGVDLSNTCMLVSDSNEIGNQLESKKLAYDTLVELAEDNLFKKYLDMTKYLTINQYDAYKGILEDRYNSLSALFRTLPTPIANYQPKFRVVDG